MAIGLIPFTLLSLSAAFVLNFIYRFVTHRRFFAKLPKPPHSFLWGHLKLMGEIDALLPPNCHPQIYYTVIAQKYDLGPIFYMDLWPLASAQVILTDPALMSAVSVSKPLAQHPLSDDFLAPVLGRNVIAAINGPIWKSLHNAMSPAFSWSHIHALSSVFASETLTFRSTLSRLSETGSPFSMEDLAGRLIFDAIARIVFNTPLHAQTPQGSPYLDDLREMVRLAESRMSWNPLVHLRAFFRRRAVLGRLHPNIHAKILERLRHLRTEGRVPSRRDPESILDLMLREHLLTNKTDTLPDMTLLTTNIKGLLLGGHGTTTSTLSYALALLSTHPRALSTLRTELDRTLGPSTASTLHSILHSPTAASSLSTKSLPYTSAVLKETARLFPTGFGVKIARDGDTLTANDARQPFPLTCPTDTLVVVCCGKTTHYDPGIFTDPDEFKPERWLVEHEEDGGNAKTSDDVVVVAGEAKAKAKAKAGNGIGDTAPSKAFWTFGKGPRACLGQNLAMAEMKVILALTVREFDFEFLGSSLASSSSSAAAAAAQVEAVGVADEGDKGETVTGEGEGGRGMSIGIEKARNMKYTRLDRVLGDAVFQALGIEAKTRGGMWMRVRRREGWGDGDDVAGVEKEMVG